MNFKTTLSALAISAMAIAAAPAQAGTAPPCSITDITPNAAACFGFIDGQWLSSTTEDIAMQKTALSALGFTTWDGSTVFANLSGLGGADPTFSSAISGITYIGVHYGAGRGSPNPPPNGSDTTAWYKFDAGTTGITTLHLNYGASSDVVVYSTTPVPEPETYALMLAGLAAVGFVARRRKSA